MAATPFVQKPNKAGIFPNDKRKTESHPHFTGTLTLSPDLVAELYLAAQTGKDARVDLSLWKQTSQQGKGYLSLQVKKAWEPDPTRTMSPPRSPPPQSFEDDDDLPF